MISTYALILIAALLMRYAHDDIHFLFNNIDICSVNEVIPGSYPLVQ